MPGKEDVRDRLREAILRGVYAPRQRLIEAELAEEYGASRFVLRNALLSLESEGLVELQPNRGARVREITVEEAIEITEVRMAIEGLVAARAAQRATAEDHAYLRALEAQMRATVETGELLKYSELNAELHGRIRAIADHRAAVRVLDLMHAQVVRHQYRLALVPGRPRTSLPEHAEIIDAICVGDADRAARAMSAHVGSVLGTLETLRSPTPVI